jgi:hypothetical protein
MIIIAGRIATFGPLGSLALKMPIELYSNPREAETTDRRAGCGRSARPVRREGWRKPMRYPYPYSVFRDLKFPGFPFSRERRLFTKLSFFGLSLLQKKRPPNGVKEI